MSKLILDGFPIAHFLSLLGGGKLWSVLTLIDVYLTVQSALTKHIKDLYVRVGFIKGFELKCSFFEDQDVD